MPVDTMGRELIELVQIDQDFCNNTYGVAPCTATTGDPSTKCFNTYFTCQDQPNYDRGTKTITLQKDVVNGAPDGVYAIPTLSSFNKSASEVNIGARRSSAFSLGKLSSLTAIFKDLPFSDNHLDPYVSERNYNPLENGTFWSKWIARNPYFEGFEIRVYEGLVGQGISEMSYSKFLIDKVSNPNANGGVTINAVDPFRKLDAVKAQFPTQTQAELLLDITDVDTSITTSGKVNLSNEFGGDYFSIATEICSFVSEIDNGNGSYSYTGILRGLFGSESVEHKAGDSVQHTVYFDPDQDSSGLFNILILLFDSAGFELSDLDILEWNNEINTWLSQFSRLQRVLFKPVAINQLIGELSESCGFFIWFDDILKKVKLKAVRPETTPIITLDEDSNLLQGSASSKLETNERISQVWIDYNVTNFTADLNKRENYTSTKARIDLEAESANEYGESVVYNTQAKWLYSLAQIDTLGYRTISRYRDNTRFVSFQLDIKDSDLEVGQAFKLNFRGFSDVFGNNLELLWQVISRERKSDIITIKAQEFYFTGNYCFIMPDDANDYDNSTEEEKSTSGYISPTSDGTEYLII